jgi:hypothetical protein
MGVTNPWKLKKKKQKKSKISVILKKKFKAVIKILFFLKDFFYLSMTVIKNIRSLSENYNRFEKTYMKMNAITLRKKEKERVKCWFYLEFMHIY